MNTAPTFTREFVLDNQPVEPDAIKGPSKQRLVRAKYWWVTVPDAEPEP